MTPRDQKDKIPNLITRRSNNTNNNTNHNSNQLKSRSRETQRQDRTQYSNAPYTNNDNNNASSANNNYNEAWRKQPKPGCVEIKLLVSKNYTYLYILMG